MTGRGSEKRRPQHVLGLGCAPRVVGRPAELRAGFLCRERRRLAREVAVVGQVAEHRLDGPGGGTTEVVLVGDREATPVVEAVNHGELVVEEQSPLSK